MRALVTGGAGFIGSHLADALLARGDEVRVLDDLSTGSRRNIAGAMKSGRFEFFEGSVLDRALVKDLVGWSETVYHLAAAVGVKYIIDHPLDSIRVNVGGTELVFEMAQRGGQKVVLASTSEIYGKAEAGQFKETDDRVLGTTTIGRWSYSCTKALDEFLALAYHREQGVPVVIVRLFNTCGPRQTGRYGMVVPRFVEQALKGEPITVYGDGMQTRSFTYVSDVVRAMLALAGTPAAVGEVFNVGGETGITIGELAELVKKLASSNSEIIRVPYEDAYETGFEDMRHRIPDVSKLKDTIGYKPEVGLEEILEKTVEDVRGRIGHEDG